MARRWYISGPMSNHLNYNYGRFHAAKAILESHYQDDTVISPPDIPHTLVPGVSSWLDFHRENVKWLLECSEILMLGGWPASKGARAELRIALDLRMAVWFLTDANEIVNMTVGDRNSERNGDFI